MTFCQEAMQIARWIIVALLFVSQGYSLAAEKRIHYHEQCCERTYNTSARPVPDKLNVHLVAHTHDDVGWLKTVDQYFVGSNNSIQVAAVQYILDSVVSALQADPNRKFIYVEQAFFQRWWREQTQSTKKAVKRLVKKGQLEFINGGWCMHDEAATHYIDMIDQITLGHRFIKQQFDKVPRIGWQIDPFGHSAVQAYLLGGEVGFDGLFFARADYQDVARRRRDRTMEVIWRGSKSLGSSSQIFAGVLANHYEPPEGFSFDIDSEYPPVQDDPNLFDYNVNERVDLFVQRAQEQATQFRTNHLMWTMGDDFAYEYAQTWFKQMDKLVHYVNKDGRVNAFYSTPSIYVDMKNAVNATWPLKFDDFFPYASSANGYWTGYFTSRPALKGYVRKLSSYLQAARQLEFMTGRQKFGPNTDSLEEAMAILQHHDGVSGTEKQHVADDYSKRLAMSFTEAEDVVNRALAWLVDGKSASSTVMEEITSSSEHRLLREGLDSGVKLGQCPLSNISYCPPSEVNLTGQSLVVIAYNPLGWERKEIVRITVGNQNLEVYDSYGNAVPSQIVPINPAVRRLRDQYVQSLFGTSDSDKPLFTLVFPCNVPPLGYATYHVRMSYNETLSAKLSSIQKDDFNQDVLLHSHSTQFAFSSSTGQLEEIKKNGRVISVKQSYCWYNASDGNTDATQGQASGAYVFRPNSSACFPVANLNGTVISSVVRGPLVQEVHQDFAPWLSQVVKINNDADYAEVEFTVGPIPIDDQLGKEVVARLSSDLQSNMTFYTDSNGRDFLKRVRNFRSDWDLEVHEEIAGNYYPLNSGIYLTDKTMDLSVLVDRAIGGSSIADGELELMLHRRLLYDDGKGVAEPLNETTCLGSSVGCNGLVIQGSFFLSGHLCNESARWRRNLIQRLLSPLQLAFAVTPDEGINESYILQFSAMSPGYKLPPNVAIITLQELNDGSVLLRLAHLFEIDEDDELSDVAVVDLQKLFALRMINNVSELSLSANQKKSNMRSLKWQVEGDANGNMDPPRSSGFIGNDYLVELLPMEMRTFAVDFDH